jgi:D-alanyl-D-alanine carboxypeptidase
VRSANDAAVVAAELLAGSEAAFAKMMNAKAKALRMSDTVFRNASGLPDSEQVTTARDMAILAVALQKHFPRHYHLFSVRSFKYRGKTYETYNGFMTEYDGADGLKTGFTCHAGYNLVSSAERDGRRLIGVILGERNRRQRDIRMGKLLNLAFARKDLDEEAQTIESLVDAGDPDSTVSPGDGPIADVCIGKAPRIDIAAAPGWGLMVGVRKDKSQALTLASKALRTHRETINGGRPLSIPFIRGVLLYRACIMGLRKENAIAACKSIRKGDKYCIVMTPKLTRLVLTKGRTALERARRLGMIN